MFCPRDGATMTLEAEYVGELAEWTCPHGHCYEAFDGSDGELHMTETEPNEIEEAFDEEDEDDSRPATGD